MTEPNEPAAPDVWEAEFNVQTSQGDLWAIYALQADGTCKLIGRDMDEADAVAICTMHKNFRALVEVAKAADRVWLALRENQALYFDEPDQSVTDLNEALVRLSEIPK